MSAFSEGQIHLLANALESAGFTPADVTALGQNAPVHLGLTRGTHRAIEIEKPVAVWTLDTTHASMPQAWKDAEWGVEEHKGLGIITVRFANGEMYINGRKVDEHLAEKQKVGTIGGHDLRRDPVGKPTLPDGILDLLIREQDNPGVKMFLQKYKGRYPFFWGTIYRSPDGSLGVRCLVRDGSRFGWSSHCLDRDWFAGDPALVLAPVPLESGT